MARSNLGVSEAPEPTNRRESTLPKEPLNEDENRENPLCAEILEDFEFWINKDWKFLGEAYFRMRSEYEKAMNNYNAAVDANDHLRRDLLRKEGIIEYQRELIRERETAPTQSAPTTPPVHQSSPAPTSGTVGTAESKAQKIIKLPDPPMFTDNKDPNIDDWLSKMRSKLEANADHFLTETLRKAYVENRIGGDANKHIAPRLRKDSRNPFHTAEDIFACLFRVFGGEKGRREKNG